MAGMRIERGNSRDGQAKPMLRHSPPRQPPTTGPPQRPGGSRSVVALGCLEVSDRNGRRLRAARSRDGSVPFRLWITPAWRNVHSGAHKPLACGAALDVRALCHYHEPNGLPAWTDRHKSLIRIRPCPDRPFAGPATRVASRLLPPSGSGAEPGDGFTLENATAGHAGARRIPRPAGPDSAPPGPAWGRAPPGPSPTAFASDAAYAPPHIPLWQ